MLTGAAGTGKNVICKQVAQALGLKFYFSNAVTQEYKLTGFTDANGRYQPTQFYKAFTEGGVFMLDEIDASIPEVLVILNSAIANGYFDFPAPIGYVDAHPDFRVVAAGNTTGNGADFEYVGRNQLDASSLEQNEQDNPRDDCCQDEKVVASGYGDRRLAACRLVARADGEVAARGAGERLRVLDGLLHVRRARLETYLPAGDVCRELTHRSLAE